MALRAIAHAAALAYAKRAPTTRRKEAKPERENQASGCGEKMKRPAMRRRLISGNVEKIEKRRAAAA